MTALAKISQARRALEAAKSLDDILAIRDQAKAIKTFLEAAHESLEAQNSAAEIRIRAERKAGEITMAMEKAKTGPKTNGKVNYQPDKKQQLEEAGISNAECQRIEAIATVPDKEFEQLIDPETATADNREVTSAAVIKRGKQIKREKKKKKREATRQKQEEETSVDWDIIHGDCVRELKKLKDVALIFADPPYNIGIDYGQGKEADLLPPKKYLAWCERWISAGANALTSDGAFWLLVCDEYAAELAVIMSDCGLVRRNWIKWYETFGNNCTTKFNRTSRHLFYFVKADAKKLKFNRDHPAVNRKSDRQLKYKDKRASSTGKNLDDVWVIPRLTGTAKERISGFPTQLPKDLLRPIVGACTEPGDLVVDPFCGSGTTGIVAVENHCRFVGIEKEKRFWSKARTRMKNEKPIYV